MRSIKSHRYPVLSWFQRLNVHCSIKVFLPDLGPRRLATWLSRDFDLITSLCVRRSLRNLSDPRRPWTSGETGSKSDEISTADKTNRAKSALVAVAGRRTRRDIAHSNEKQTYASPPCFYFGSPPAGHLFRIVSETLPIYLALPNRAE
ncbi:hypothetical protein EVAR_101940_1 [Eumeta japonica]|uniref:Uncharacterized protein n=1 Tax=Eumeta variegata TaxID=151549 RepID=A0A4C1TSE9_EUMVA|nr:hypothetical protein EVAR_101940_1 [Eumeta japonica]